MLIWTQREDVFVTKVNERHWHKIFKINKKTHRQARLYNLQQ